MVKQEFSYVDFIIHTHSEEQLERIIKTRCANHRGDEVFLHALKKIDQLQIEGKYKEYLELLNIAFKEEDEFLARKVDETNKIINEHYMYEISNFNNGLRSKDEEQRKRFEEVYDKENFATRPHTDVLHILRIAERVKISKKKGPKIGLQKSKKDDYIKSFILMKRLCAEGKTPRAAAMEITGNENKASYLSKKFQDKMKLREDWE
ncbi:hypothetical protein [Beijerinckia mobilis]|uniref:hypothetical protein n=1 Tax=Beijerinckia mobilis TaxID=231434 RepID=UPI000550E3F5|nr:hypothetical protein [Beijerinckia mobilis]